MTEQELSKLFPSLEPGLIQEIATVGDVKQIGDGELMMRTGQNIRAAILVVDGLVKVFRQSGEGDEYFMYYIDAGKACAMSLVSASGTETSGVMARAVTDSTVVSIPLHYVDEWLGKYKSWAQFVVNSYRDRFEELLVAIDHIAFRNMDERLVFYLKTHRDNEKSNIVNTSFTEIAQELNSSREVISRIMRKLADRNMIRLHKSYIELLNLDAEL